MSPEPQKADQRRCQKARSPSVEERAILYTLIADDCGCGNYIAGKIALQTFPPYC